jgi:hypothetical protein
VTLPVLSFDRQPAAATVAAIDEADRLASEAGAAEHRRRHIVRLIDLAIEACEELNLQSETYRRPKAPAWVLGLVEWLQVKALLPTDPPRNSQQAHEALLDLQAGYLPESPVPHAEEEAWLAAGGGLELPA